MDGASSSPPPAAREHPFARFLRTVGRGSTLSRPLTRDEAGAAMAMILKGEVEPLQLGALLLLLRYRAETPEELAGFVDAARRAIGGGLDGAADLDWPSYADRHKQLPYFLLAALLLAENGIAVVLHGIDGISPATTPATLRALGVALPETRRQAMAQLRAQRFVYLPLSVLCPPLAGLFDVRPVLGVRSPANSFCRALNPLAAPAQLQGVFHPAYIDTHAATARLLAQPRAAIFKGGGGEAQRNPEKPCRVAALQDGEVAEETWPVLTADDRHPWRDEELDPRRVAALWRGDWTAPGPEAAIAGTAAIALKLLGRAGAQDEALALAARLWRDRRRHAHGG